jgi:hypothetical protein
MTRSQISQEGSPVEREKDKIRLEDVMFRLPFSLTQECKTLDVPEFEEEFSEANVLMDFTSSQI